MPKLTPQLPPVAPKGSHALLWGGAAVAGLAALFYLMAEEEQKPAPAAPAATTPEPQKPAFSDWFYITNQSETGLYSDPGLKLVETLGEGSCIKRFSLMDSSTLSGLYLHVTAFDDTGYLKSGYIDPRFIEPAPRGTSENNCLATFVNRTP